MKITEPVVLADGATCHLLETVIEAGLRQHRRNGAVIPDRVLVFARDVTAVAGTFRMSVRSSGVGGVSGDTPPQEFAPTRRLDTQEVAVVAGITPSGVREAHRCGRLLGKKVGRELQFDSEDVNRWLAKSGR